MRRALFSPLLLLVLGVPRAFAATQPDPAEVRAYLEAAERYEDRMREFIADARRAVEDQEDEDRSRLSAIYGGAIQRSDDREGTMRRTAITRLEAFLQKYPSSTYTADMEFRLADLYFEESELDFMGRMEEYQSLSNQAAANPAMTLPDAPTKDYSRSIALYHDIIDHHGDYPYVVNTYYMLGWCLSSATSKQYDEDAARDAYQTIASRFPKTDAANDANMKLGEYYFDHTDTADTATVNLPIAVRYYEAVMADGPSGRNYDEAIYKLGWAHFRLGNLDRSLSYLVQLLDFSDKQFMDSGKNSSMRPEAVQYLAISYADIAHRNGDDALDVARKHQQKVGERKWQHDVFVRLAENLDKQAYFDEAIETYAYLQEHWPNDPENPSYQYKIANIYLKLPPSGDPVRASAAFSQLADRYKLGSSWAIANKNNPEAIAKSRDYIEGTLGDVARQYLAAAQQSRKPEDFAAAAAKLGEFIDSFPDEQHYDEDVWYQAYALYNAGNLPEAEKLYQLISRSSSSPYRDQARYQLMLTRQAEVIQKFGKADIRPPDAVVDKTVTSPFGKPLTIYRISDEQTKLVAAMDDVVDREFKDADARKALNENRVKLLYIAGRIFEEHGQYDEGRKRLMRVVMDYPDSPEAQDAATLYVNTYTAEGDLEGVIAATERLQRYHGMGDRQQEAVFSKCYDLTAKTQYLPAAQCYDQYIAKYPTSPYLKDALFNAANNYERGGQASRSIQLFEQYINQYPTDKRSEDLYVRLGENYSSILELDKAIRYFEALPKLDVNHVDAPVAQSNAAFLKIGVGDHSGAAQSLEDYARLFPNQPDAEKLYWKAGEQWELVSVQSAQSFYARYLTKFAATGDPNHQIEALYRIASFKESKKQSATAEWTRLQDVYRANAGGSLSQRSRSLAAEGALKDLQAEYERFKTYKFTGNEKKDVQLLTETKSQEIKAFSDHALQLIQTYQDFDTATASLYLQGMALFAYSDMFYATPMPKGFSEEEQGIYQEQLDKFRIPIEDRGKARLNAALEKASAEKRWNDWVSKAQSALHDRYPSEFPSERAETQGSVQEQPMGFEGPVSMPAPEVQ